MLKIVKDTNPQLKEKSVEVELPPSEENIKIVKRGYIDIDSLSVEQQKTFYATLLARILELYKKQKECN